MRLDKSRILPTRVHRTIELVLLGHSLQLLRTANDGLVCVRWNCCLYHINGDLWHEVGKALKILQKDLDIVFKHAAGLLVVSEELHLIKRRLCFLFQQTISSFRGHCSYSRLRLSHLSTDTDGRLLSLSISTTLIL